MSESRRPVKPYQTLLLVAFAALAVAGNACGDTAGSRASDDVPAALRESPRILTPVAQAQDLGIKPYWLGTQFRAGTKTFDIDRNAELVHLSDPSIAIAYHASDRGTLAMETFAKGGADSRVRVILHKQGVARDRATVGSWNAQVFTVPDPVEATTNQVIVFFETDDAAVLVSAPASTSGIPGDDANPLLAADLLLSALEENLRPYPE